jgi:hypothetical protein
MNDIDPQKALESILNRMIRARWVSGFAHDDKGLLIQWTKAGGDAAKQLRSLFDQLGEELFADELSALLVVLDTMSPGGGDKSESARVK